MSEEGTRGRAGIPNFSDEEINYLLYLIEANASLGLELWPLVASKYAKWSQAQAIYPRSLKSLKNKFDKIVNSRVTPEPQYVRRAKQLWKRISAYPTGRGHENNMRTDEVLQESPMMGVGRDGEESTPHTVLENLSSSFQNPAPPMLRSEDRTVSSAVDQFRMIMDYNSKAFTEVFKSQVNASSSLAQQVMQAHQDILVLKTELSELKRTITPMVSDFRELKRDTELISGNIDRLVETVGKPRGSETNG
uniref:Uncharacterized protein n=1 Tax=Rhodosorus marinus TaxID=101924 RepID=A0A7S2ZZA3_9RHOD|mmetsp:Transcript_34829/g.137418  ORF Transcript_34829/g.137418 Transcript_34829/m.137418 type:complete len:249 (+) Transcript_34829:209-955(+)